MEMMVKLLKENNTKFKYASWNIPLQHGASLLSRPAEEFGNDSLVEEMWAAKALEHAEVHFNVS